MSTKERLERLFIGEINEGAVTLARAAYDAGYRQAVEDAARVARERASLLTPYYEHITQAIEQLKAKDL